MIYDITKAHVPRQYANVFDYVQHVNTVDIKYMCLIVNVSCATVGWSSP